MPLATLAVSDRLRTQSTAALNIEVIPIVAAQLHFCTPAMAIDYDRKAQSVVIVVGKRRVLAGCEYAAACSCKGATFRRTAGGNVARCTTEFEAVEDAG
jgi:hypothetical protein